MIRGVVNVALFWRRHFLKRKSALSRFTLTSAAVSTLGGLAWLGKRGGQRYVRKTVLI